MALIFCEVKFSSRGFKGWLLGLQHAKLRIKLTPLYATEMISPKASRLSERLYKRWLNCPRLAAGRPKVNLQEWDPQRLLLHLGLSRSVEEAPCLRESCEPEARALAVPGCPSSLIWTAEMGTWGPEQLRCRTS